MRYTLLLHYPEHDAESYPEHDAESIGAQDLEEAQRAFASYAATLHQAGVLVGAEVLQPSTATTTLTLVDGALRIQDGPFADTKEALGGTVVIDVPDLDAAIHWARQVPSIEWGAVEIRPGAAHTVAGGWTPHP